MRFILALTMLIALGARAATYTVDISSGATEAAVKTAYRLTTDGDTVLLPDATYPFNSVLTVTNMVTFMGTSTNGTIILDAIPNANRGAAYPGLFYFQVVSNVAGHYSRISTLQFKKDGTNNTVTSAPNIYAWFRGQGFIADHLFFNDVRARPFWFRNNSVDQNMGGVVSKVYWTNTLAAGVSGWFMDCFGENGHYSMANPVDYNSTNGWIVFEDCVVGNVKQKGWCDPRGGGRVVVRHSSFYNATLESHETEHAMRGLRAMVFDSNTMRSTASAGSAFLYRSGTGIVCSNNIITGYPQMLTLGAYRALSYGTVDAAWGTMYGANGTNGWDLNYTNIYDSGTCGGASTNTLNKYLFDTNKTWTPSQWLGYSIINLANKRGGLISSNGVNWIGLYTNDVQIGPWNETFWTNGNTYQIHRVDSAFSQPGEGQGALLSGGSQFVNATPYGWPNPIKEPIHCWANTGITNISAGRYNLIILNGRDYTNAAFPGYIGIPYPHPLIRLVDGLAPIVPVTVTTIANQSVLVDGTVGPLSFTIGGGATNVNSYTLSYVSTVTALVPNAATNVVFGGSGASRNITVYPVASQTGSTAITVIVTDEVGTTATSSFTITVFAAGNVAPTITTVANQSLLLSQTTGALSFTVGDLETPAGSLVVTSSSSDTNCIPTANVSLGGSGVSRNVTVLASTVPGFSTITLSVSDGTTNTTTSFIVSVYAGISQSLINTKTARIGRFTFP